MHYRQIWEEYNNKKIPPGYEIHHKDGDRKNNDPNNLVCLSIEEHLEIHKKQQDWGAVQAILSRMENKEGINEAASKFQLEKMKEGNHNFQLMTKERRTEISKKSGAKARDMKVGIHAINADPEKKKEYSKMAGLISKQKKAGFHDPNKTGGVFVKGTCWWTNKKTGERIREKFCPGEEWKRGMKNE